VPFAIRVGAGNENERRMLLPLLDDLLARGIRPPELWADRGYDGERLREEIRERGVEPVISARRRPGQPAAADAIMIERGGRRVARDRDPLGRQRWPVERTNSWMRNWRRVSTRWERNPDYWLAVIQAAAAMVAWQILEHSFR
jgi:transposase